MRSKSVTYLLGFAILLAHPQSAAACSAGPFDPRDHTQLLVLGRPRSLELGPRTNTGFVEATVTLDVIYTYRGTPSPTVRFVDHSSLALLRDPRTGRQDVEYAGGSGACGTIDADPVGQYVLIALARGEDARWHANRLYGSSYADEPRYEMHRWILARHGIVVAAMLGASAPDAALAPLLVP